MNYKLNLLNGFLATVVLVQGMCALHVKIFLLIVKI